jgi:hypothetical protein
MATQPDHATDDAPAAADSAPAPGHPPRPDNLLPADDDPDGRFRVAEEVSLDQQSDEARRIGGLPPDPAPGADLYAAVATTLSEAPPPR